MTTPGTVRAGPADVNGVGAYGLRLQGVSAARRLLVPAEPDWRPLRIVRRRGRAASGHEHISDESARLLLVNGGEIVVDREPARAVFRVPEGVGTADLVHPYLAPVAAVMAHWHARESFHAGAFVLDVGAWILLGDRESGKSSTLAWLAQRGHPIVADDLVVVQDGVALCGPRSVDLRRDAAERLDAGTPLGVVGARERWRVSVADVRSSWPLHGWIHLRFGDRVSVTKLTAGDRALLLARHRALRVRPRNPVASLELSALPGWELSRPRDWAALPDALEQVFEAIAG